MSVLGRRLSRVETRDYAPSWSIPTPTSGYWNASGYPVTTETALRHAAFYACVNLIANSLATTPIDAYRKRGDRRETLPVQPTVLTEPSPGMTQVEWFFSLLTSLLIRGNAYGYKSDFSELSYPRQIELIHPDEVSVRYADSDRRRLEYRFNGEIVPLERVFHLKGFTMPGWVEGLSVVAHHAQTIGMGLAAGTFAAGFYQSGGMPSSVIESEMIFTPEQAEAVQSRIAAKIQAHGRAPIALGAGFKWKPIQATPAESQFLEAQRYTAVDIARLFNVPGEKIGAVSEGKSLTYGNREANVIEFQTDALLPWAVRIEQGLDRLLPRGQFVKFNLDAAIRVDIKTRYEVHGIGIDKGFLTVDEVRELEDREPLPEPEPVEEQPPLQLVREEGGAP